MRFNQGCDFLGFNIRRFRGKLLTKPSDAALRRIRDRLSTEMKALRGGNADAVISKLTPIIKGWAAYYRIGVSKRAFNDLDAHMWRLTYKWATLSHPNKSKRWITDRYFGLFNPSRVDRWVFGDRDSGFYLRKFAWTKIERHRMVPGIASPDDPTLADYWARRRRRRRPRRTRPPSAYSRRRTAAARDAEACCWPQTRNDRAPRNGSSGSRSCGSRFANRRSSPASPTTTPRSNSYTATASIGINPTPAAARQTSDCL